VASQQKQKPKKTEFWEQVKLDKSTRWGGLRDREFLVFGLSCRHTASPPITSGTHTSGERMNKIQPVRRLISFPPTCSLLFSWQPGPTGKVRSEAVNPVVSRPGRLRTSHILKALSVSLAVTPPGHHIHALLSKMGELRQNQ